MAYKKSYRQSPNYTARQYTRSVWGVDRKVREIQIHWWGDPKTKPTFEGVISVLANPARQASAHYVAEAGRVCQMVNENDNAWATNSGNPHGISIECNPRCSAGDRQTVGELVADIRKRWGNVPLVPHNKYVATQCPGTYQKYFAEINRIASKPAPKPTPSYDSIYRVYDAKGNQVGAYSVDGNAWNKFVAIGKKGKIIFKGANVTATLEKKFVKPPAPKPDPVPQPAEQNVPTPPAPKPNDPTPDSVAGTDRIGEVEKRVSTLEGWTSFLEFLKSLFKW